MTIDVKIPSVGESITRGILSKWHVTDGQQVQSGAVLYELETDKITQEGTAAESGCITLKAAEGDEVAIGQVVAVIDTAASGSTAEAPTPVAEKSEPLPGSPAVKRLAAESKIDPQTVTGTGKAGRVTKTDMLQAIETQPKVAPPSHPKPTPPVQSKPTIASTDRVSRKRMTPLRKRIAERLVAAQQSAAILTTFNEVDMGPVMQLRKLHQDSFVKKHGVKLGFMSFFVKATVLALKEIPSINAQIEGDTILQNHYFDIGVAISTPKGLMVPVIRDADQKSFAQIEQDILDYAAKAKDGKITIEDLQGGVFTITNGGIFGSMLSTPILNQPQSGILGMHAINDRPMAVNGQVVIRPMMYLALSYDHRLVDGREAVTFLRVIKDAIEDPTRLLLSI
jgi:2-oxoglutarate dehydrogenase E2 component (dihydrolipoamide succinyltransferase)